ncbi:protein PFC0760c-like [Cydia pomonella]|uniref:protein PFC0760c-like n=1 Tax=Cydia pomonella TaxID=82600 RepID=UPI002ADD4FB0|nr:protein PFC0760c-like [Cydia pomonella]
MITEIIAYVLIPVLLVSAICGVHSTSIPSNSAELDKSDSTLEPPLLSTLESKLDSELDTDNLKQSVLESVKILLESKLSSLARNGDHVGSDGITKQRSFKPKSRLRPTSNRKEKTNQESNSSEDSHNSEFIKVLTDDSNQDPGDEALREAVDELLEENKTDENKDEVILDDSTQDPEELKDYNNDEKISKDAYGDITTQVTKNSKKYRKDNKIDHRKKSNSVIVKPLIKMFKNDDRNKLKVISDEKLKSTLKDIDYDVEHANDADGISANRKSKEVRNNMLLNRGNRYWKRKPYITKYSQKPHKVDNLKIGESSNVDGINFVSYNEKPVEMETPTSVHQDKNGNNDKINILTNLANNNVDFKRKLLTNNLKQNSKNDKDLIDFSESEINYQDNIPDKLIKEDIETEINENQNQELIYHKEKPKQKLDKNYSNYHRIGRDKLEKNNNDKQKENSNNEELNDSDKFDDNNDINKSIAYEEKKPDFQLKDFLINNKIKAVKVQPDERKDDKRIEENIKFGNEEDIAEGDDDVTSGVEHVIGKYLEDREDYIFEKEEDITKRDNFVTYVDKINNTGKKKRVTKDKIFTEEGTSASKKGKQSCRENNVESDETKIIRDLIQNKEVKKSFSFSLNFISQ